MDVEPLSTETIASVVREYANMVYRLAFAQVRSRSDADDIFQEVFLRYVRNALVFQSEEHRKEVGLAVAFNTCLMREDFYNGTFERILESVKDYKACLIQIIKPKPAGGWLEKGDIDFTLEDLAYIKAKVNQYNLQKEFSAYPAISAQIIEEDKAVFGCTAGGTDRFYINAKGDLQPCEFLNMSYGNIANDEFEDIYQTMRSCFAWGGEAFLCESCSKEIYKIYQENRLKSLPLPPELSKKIYSTWDRGGKTDLYERLEKLR